MKVLKVIHGFPPDYMAGSEIYSYHLVKELVSKNIDVHVFTRVENEFHNPYHIYDEVLEGIPIRRVNKPKRDYLYSDKFFDSNLDEIYYKYLLDIKPDIVHFGHLSHLSTNLIKISKDLNIPIIFTIHDFWMFCVKGQLINKNDKICKGPTVKDCTNCSPYVVEKEEVTKTLIHMREMINMIDIFISPSKTLKKFYVSQGIDENKIKYSKYGFNTTKIKFNRQNFTSNYKLNFGFMGRLIPNKGIKVLIDAFNELKNQNLYIYGKIGSQKRFLESDNIHFMGGFNNNNINKVLNDIDVLIVPSIWYENAPLVIQEAFLAGIPVITSDIGGMSELVENGINGFTFEVGNKESLIHIIKKIVKNPTLLNSLKNSVNDVVSISEDSQKIITIYKRLIDDYS